MVNTTIITVNYNQAAVTIEMLQSVFDTRNDSGTEIIVVDNGSEPENESRIRAAFPNVRLIRSEKNLGFAGGNNLAVQQAKGRFLFFVNNDTVFTPGLIPTLIETFEKNPRAGVVCPQINYYEPSSLIQFAGFTPINFITCRNRCIGAKERDNGQWRNQILPTAFPHGAAMMVKREVVEKAGGMDEQFFLYFEEMDWAEKIKNLGYELLVNTHALIYHKESVSTGKNSPLKEYFMVRNRILFIRRNAPPLKRLLFYCYFTAVVAPKTLAGYFLKGEWKLVSPFFKALRWNLTHRANPQS